MYTDGPIPGWRRISSFARVCTGVLLLASLMAAGCTGDPAGTILLPARQTNPDRDPPAAAVKVDVHNDSEYPARVQVDCYIGNTLVHHREAVLEPLSGNNLNTGLLLGLDEADRVVVTCRIDGPGQTALWTDQQTYRMGADFADLDTVTYLIVYPPPNTPPVAVIAAPASQPSGATVTLDGSGSYDPDGDPITYTWEQLAATPDTTVTLSSTTSPVVTFTAPTVSSPIYTFAGPAATGPVTLTFQLIVNDGQLDSAPATVTVDVEPAYQPPVAVATAPTSAKADDLVALDGSGSLGTGPLTYQWTQVGEPSVFLSNADQAIATFYAPSTGGTLTFELTVSDGVNSDADVVSVYCAPLGSVNRPPVADAGYAPPAVVGETVLLDGSYSYDPDEDPLTYHWAQVNCPPDPAVELQPAEYPWQVTFVVPDTITAPQTLTFQLVVNDGLLDSAPATVTVDVAPIGQ